MKERSEGNKYLRFYFPYDRKKKKNECEVVILGKTEEPEQG